MKYKCLSIAGFDGSGGAGIQADLKTFAATGCYGLTILTALPAQNTLGVKSCHKISLTCIKDQLEAVFEDITPDAIKIGMLFSEEIIELVADFLKKHAINIPIVLDPVMVAKSGDLLLQKEATKSLKKILIPMATIITPNLPEAKVLTPGILEKNELAQNLLNLGCAAVLLKGGHDNSANCDDLFVSKTEKELLSSPRIKSKNTHGTGCTLSSAIASFIAQGFSVLKACKKSKEYLFNAIFYAKDQKIGKGSGPVDHFYSLKNLD